MIASGAAVFVVVFVAAVFAAFAAFLPFCRPAVFTPFTAVVPFGAFAGFAARHIALPARLAQLVGSSAARASGGREFSLIRSFVG